jgi:hypothetical protein
MVSRTSTSLAQRSNVSPQKVGAEVRIAPDGTRPQAYVTTSTGVGDSEKEGVWARGAADIDRDNRHHRSRGAAKQ